VLGCSAHRDEEREAIERRTEKLVEQKRDFEAKLVADKERAERARVDIPALLAKLVKDPDAQKPDATENDGNLERRVYAIPQFSHAQLVRVKGHPEAWSWILMNPSGLAVKDLGPSGAVRDLLPGKAAIGGFAVSGVFYRIDAGPLQGAVAINSVPGITKDHTIQLATIAYHRLSDSMMMSALCDLGAVDGVAAESSSPFKDKCLAAVAKQTGRPEAALFPKPWMLRVATDNTCAHELSDTVEAWKYSCRDVGGKLEVRVSKAR
jgi:hypothetical protein